MPGRCVSSPGGREGLPPGEGDPHACHGEGDAAPDPHEALEPPPGPCPREDREEGEHGRGEQAVRRGPELGERGALGRRAQLVAQRGAAGLAARRGCPSWRDVHLSVAMHVRLGAAVDALQTRAVPSSPPVTTYSPFGLNAAEFT